MDTNTPTQYQNFARQLKDNWFIIIFIGGLIIGWTNFNNRLDSSEKEHQGLTNEVARLNADNVELKGAIIEIKANYIFIKEALTNR